MKMDGDIDNYDDGNDVFVGDGDIFFDDHGFSFKNISFLQCVGKVFDKNCA